MSSENWSYFGHILKGELHSEGTELVEDWIRNVREKGIKDVRNFGLNN